MSGTKSIVKPKVLRTRRKKMAGWARDGYREIHVAERRGRPATSRKSAYRSQTWGAGPAGVRVTGSK